MSEVVRIKNMDKIGCVEEYQGDGQYLITLENQSQGLFSEGELEFLNVEPYPNLNHRAIKNLILMVNNSKAFECMDIDNEGFIDGVCKRTGLDRGSYFEIMELEEEKEKAVDSIQTAIEKLEKGYPWFDDFEYAFGEAFCDAIQQEFIQGFSGIGGALYAVIQKNKENPQTLNVIDEVFKSVTCKGIVDIADKAIEGLRNYITEEAEIKKYEELFS